MLFTSNSNSKNSNLELKYIDLFCGIGGFRIALELVCSHYKFKEHKIKPICVFSSDIDADAQKNYEANFISIIREKNFRDFLLVLKLKPTDC